MTRSIRSSFCAWLIGALASVCASSALAGILGPFEIHAEGAGNLNGNVATFVGTPVLQPPAFNFGVEVSEATLDFNQNPIALSGMAVFDGTNGHLFLDLTGTFFIDANQGFASAAGAFDITGGDGIFAGVSGEGVFSWFFNLRTGESHTMYGGTIVPAPAGIGILAAAALLLRRRRS